MDADDVIAFQAGASYPLDDPIEQAVARRLPGRFLSYAAILRDYQEAQHIDRIETRIDTLRRLLADRPRTAFVLMGRSSGARAITKLAVSRPPNLRGLVCLGYPFRNPRLPPEPDRVAHLADLAVPTLIVQGDADVYGGAGALGGYTLSPRIAVEFVEASHELDLTPEGWDDVAACIRRFIGLLPPLLPRG